MLIHNNWIVLWLLNCMKSIKTFIMKTIKSVCATVLLLFFVCGYAHSQVTIKVTGVAEYNLSPNEIIVQLSFQEYFTAEPETKANKVKLEVLQEKVMASLKKAAIGKDKITEGGVVVVRPYKHNAELKRRLNKTLYVCVGNVDEYINLTRVLEDDGLFDEIITAFQVSEYKHTEKEKYLTKSRSEAYQDAVKKANLILSASGQKVGKVKQVNELSYRSGNEREGSFYTMDNAGSGISGFAPIVISYTLEVTFEIE